MKSFKKTILKVVNFIEGLNGNKITICLTGDFGCGKTAIGNFLEKICKDVVFLNSDYFRTNKYKNISDNELDKFLLSYDFGLLKQEQNLFLKDENFGIFIKKGNQIVKKVYLNKHTRILLIEFPFIFVKRDVLRCDFVIEIKSKKRRRTSLNSKTSILANKAMNIYKKKIKKINRPDLIVFN